MKLMVRFLVAVVVAAGLTVPAGPAAAGHHPRFSALVFSKTAAFRHESIPAGVAAIERLGARHGFRVDATEDAAAFTDRNLARYDVVVWLSTTGDVLDDAQQAAFERYIRRGGGSAGIHAASDAEDDSAWYGALGGAYYRDHPASVDEEYQVGRMKVLRRNPTATRRLPRRWMREEEWYNFRTNPRDTVRVLIEVDER